MSAPGQLAPAHRPGRELDYARADLLAAQRRALHEALRELHGAAPCACPRPWLDERACLKCGREVQR